MKKMHWIVVLLLVQATHAQGETTQPAAQSATSALTLAEAWRMGIENSIKLKAAIAAVVAAEGQSADAGGLLWNNPEVSAERSRRKAPIRERIAARITLVSRMTR